jgi:HTH-type transcriptional regulator/antitoxin HigA
MAASLPAMPADLDSTKDVDRAAGNSPAAKQSETVRWHANKEAEREQPHAHVFLLVFFGADSLERVARWSAAQRLGRTLDDASQFDRLELLDRITDEVGEDENHPLASLMDVLGVLVEKYEDEQVAELTE